MDPCLPLDRFRAATPVELDTLAQVLSVSESDPDRKRVKVHNALLQVGGDTLYRDLLVRTAQRLWLSQGRNFKPEELLVLQQAWVEDSIYELIAYTMAVPEERREPKDKADFLLRAERALFGKAPTPKQTVEATLFDYGISAGLVAGALYFWPYTLAASTATVFFGWLFSTSDEDLHKAAAALFITIHIRKRCEYQEMLDASDGAVQ